MRETPAFKLWLWWFEWSHFCQALTYDYIFSTQLLLYFVCSGCVQAWHECGLWHFLRDYILSHCIAHNLSLSFCLAIISISLSCSRQVHLLRTAGDEVTITVRYLREVPSFLKLPLGKSPVVLMPCKLAINFILLGISGNKGINHIHGRLSFCPLWGFKAVQ